MTLGKYSREADDVDCGVGRGDIRGETLVDPAPDDGCDDLRLGRTGLLLEFKAVLATKAVLLRPCFDSGSLRLGVLVSGVGGLDEAVCRMLSPVWSEIKIRVVLCCSPCPKWDFFRMGGRRV